AAYKNVSPKDEQCALVSFRQGNDLLNNGLFPQSVARYRDALRCWDHPAIHYNLALALINLDQPIEVYEQLNEAVKYGSDPIGQDKFDHARSEERRVGKECRSRWSSDDEKKKKRDART